MDTEYWNLFWMTGMPQAWVLSHGRSEAAPPPGQEEHGGDPGLMAGLQLPITGTTPADPRGIV